VLGKLRLLVSVNGCAWILCLFASAFGAEHFVVVKMSDRSCVSCAAHVERNRPFPAHQYGIGVRFFFLSSVLFLCLSWITLAVLCVTQRGS
jgi:hypothetical protein